MASEFRRPRNLHSRRNRDARNDPAQTEERSDQPASPARLSAYDESGDTYRMNLFILMRGALLALFALAGCAEPLGLFSQVPTSIEILDGNYRTLSACTVEQLARRKNQLRRTDVTDQAIVRIIPNNGEWELSFIDEEAGRLTRVEMKSPGTQASEYALAIARACAA